MTELAGDEESLPLCQLKHLGGFTNCFWRRGLSELRSFCIQVQNLSISALLVMKSVVRLSSNFYSDV